MKRVVRNANKMLRVHFNSWSRFCATFFAFYTSLDRRIPAHFLHFAAVIVVARNPLNVS